MDVLTEAAVLDNVSAINQSSLTYIYNDISSFIYFDILINLTIFVT